MRHETVPMEMEVGSAKGIFATTASGGRAFNGRRWRGKRKQTGALDRFAEELSRHDSETGDPGGDVRASAIRAGCQPAQGGAMLQRIRKRLGWQAV